MSKKVESAIEPKVISTTTFNTAIDSRVSRKELVDMIMEEQEAQLEDALESARVKYQEAITIQQNNHNIVTDAIKAAIKDPNVLKEVNKVFKEYKTKVEESVFFDYFMNNQKEMIIKLSASILVKMERNNSDRYNTGPDNVLTHTSLNKEELLKLKGIKALIKNYTDSYDATIAANAEVSNVIVTSNIFNKKGKRARSAFVREIMKNTEEGKMVLAQLDAIKENTQKLLK